MDNYTQRKPNALQNGLFTPFPYEPPYKLNPFMHNAVFNTNQTTTDMADDQATSVLSELANHLNEEGAIGTDILNASPYRDYVFRRESDAMRQARANFANRVLSDAVNIQNSQPIRRMSESYGSTPIPKSKKPGALQNGYFTPILSEKERMQQKKEEVLDKTISPKVPDAVLASTAAPVAKSKSEQAKLNNADWVTKYREKAKNVTPRVDPISMQSQMAAALRDPVYGQATATGLASGEGMLNSWIAGINSRARKDEGELANERWIKQMQDVDEDRKLRREELAESKKRYLPGAIAVTDDFLSNEDKNILDTMNKGVSEGKVFDNEIEYQKGLDAQAKAIAARQEFLDSRRRNMNITGEQLDKIGATEGMTREQAMDKYGTQRHDRSWFPKWMGGTTEFEDSVSKLFEKNYGDPRFNRMTPLQLINRIQSTGNERGANKIRAVIGDIVKEGNKIEEIVGGVRPEDPIYIRIGGQAYILEPNTMSLKDVTLR